MFVYLGKIERSDIIYGFIFGLIISISMANAFSNSAKGTFWGSVIAFIIIRSTFGKSESLASLMGWSVKRKVSYSYVFYGLTGVLTYTVSYIIGKLFIFVILLLGSGGMFDVSLLNYKNPVNYFYDILLLLGSLYIFFPVCFIGKTSLKWIWMIVAAIIRFSYGLITSGLIMKYGYEGIGVSSDIDNKSFLSSGFMEMVPNSKIHLLIFSIVVISIMIASWNISCRILGDFRKYGDNTGALLRIKKHRTKIVIGVSIMILILVGAVGAFVVSAVKEASTKHKYEKVAHSITNDNCYGPVIFEEEFYFPVKEEEMFPDVNNSEAIGYFGYTDEKISLLYVMCFENFVYVDKNDKNHTYMKMRGCDSGNYIKSSMSEKKDLSEYSCFYIWDEDWLDQTAFDIRGKKAGCNEVSREIINLLEERYGIVKYNGEDFKNYEEYYTLTAFVNKDAVKTGEIVPPHVVGCILKIDGKYYYGSKENLLEGDLLEKVKVLLKKE